MVYDIWYKHLVFNSNFTSCILGQTGTCKSQGNETEVKCMLARNLVLITKFARENWMKFPMKQRNCSDQYEANLSQRLWYRGDNMHGCALGAKPESRQAVLSLWWPVFLHIKTFNLICYALYLCPCAGSFAVPSDVVCLVLGRIACRCAVSAYARMPETNERALQKDPSGSDYITHRQHSR